jgi:hypothetical protein
MEKAELPLERRLRAIEDRLEIYNLIAGHPPSADTGNYAEAVFTADAVFDRGPNLSGAVGNKAIGANLQSAGHQAAIAGGLVHFTSLPHLTINGDTAVVVSYLQILTPKNPAKRSKFPITAARAAIIFIASSPTVGTLSARALAGRSKAAPCG